MARSVFQAYITNPDDGGVLDGAQLTVAYEAGGTATIYEQQVGGAEKDNPFTIGSDGKAVFYAEPGLYRITATQGGITSEFRNYRIGVFSNELNDITSLSSLNTAALVDGQQFNRLQFWDGTGVGGTPCYWDANRPVSEHNGGTIVDPARVSELNPATKEFNDYFTPDTVSGNTGCFVVEDLGRVGVSIYGGGGGADDSIAFQAAVDSVEGVVTGSGAYSLASNVTRNAKTVFEFAPGTTFSGAGVIQDFIPAFDAPRAKSTLVGRVEIREGYSPVAHPNGFTNFPWMGQIAWLDAKTQAGQCAVYLSGDKREPVIGPNHYVGFHSRHNNSAEASSVWGINPVVVKQVPSSGGVGGQILGMEISISNNTAEVGTPLSTGESGGLFISYIHVENRASHALATGGYPGTVAGENGFQNGLWLDGVVSDGVHINLRDEVSGNLGVKRGLDTTGVSSFSDGAITLKNGHEIVGARSDTGVFYNLIKPDSDNTVEIGAPGVTVKSAGKIASTSGAMELGNSTTSTSYVDFHSSLDNLDYDARISSAGGGVSNGQGVLIADCSQFRFAGVARPTADNSKNLGDTSFRWAKAYSREYYTGQNGVFWTSGTGTPEGVVTAPVGSMYSREDGGAGTSFYIKETGTGSTGWVAK